MELTCDEYIFNIDKGSLSITNKQNKQYYILDVQNFNKTYVYKLNDILSDTCIKLDENVYMLNAQFCDASGMNIHKYIMHVIDDSIIEIANIKVSTYVYANHHFIYTQSQDEISHLYVSDIDEHFKTIYDEDLKQDYSSIKLFGKYYVIYDNNTNRGGALYYDGHIIVKNISNNKTVKSKNGNTYLNDTFLLIKNTNTGISELYDINLKPITIKANATITNVSKLPNHILIKDDYMQTYLYNVVANKVLIKKGYYRLDLQEYNDKGVRHIAILAYDQNNHMAIYDENGNPLYSNNGKVVMHHVDVFNGRLDVHCGRFISLIKQGCQYICLNGMEASPIYANASSFYDPSNTENDIIYNNLYACVRLQKKTKVNVIINGDYKNVSVCQRLFVLRHVGDNTLYLSNDKNVRLTFSKEGFIMDV